MSLRSLHTAVYDALVRFPQAAQFSSLAHAQVRNLLADHLTGALYHDGWIQCDETPTEKDTRKGESTPELTIYRASHDSIAMGLYTTREAAKAHCEAKVRQEEPAGSIRHLSWVADDIGDQAEYELHITPAETGGLIRGTGYVVTPLAVASEYDEEADE